jgi:hypothetical protein
MRYKSVGFQEPALLFFFWTKEPFFLIFHV